MKSSQTRSRPAPSAKQLSALNWRYFADKLGPPEAASPEIRAWFDHMLALFLPAVDAPDQLPATAGCIFGFDIEAARANPDNAAVLAADATRSVLGEFAARVRTHSSAVNAEDFKSWMDEIEAATGIQGKDLLDPLRIALTGAHSGPELDQVIPLIEEGVALGLPVVSVQDRIEEFVGG